MDSVLLPRRARRIHIDTNFGSSRRHRSRKQRPCDACRRQKIACVIPITPPCRFCINHNQPCSFVTGPRNRKLISPPDGAIFASQYDAGSLTDGGQSHTGTSIGTFTGPSDNWNKSEEHHAGRVISNPESIDDTTHSSLEDGQDETAHFLGLASEQDPHMLSLFRSNILNETSYIDAKIRQVSSENGLASKPPMHFTLIQDLFPDTDQQVKQQASDVIEDYIGDLGLDLIRLYFKFVHPNFPVLSKRRFLLAYQTNKFKISPALRGVIYGLASVFWNQRNDPKAKAPLDQSILFSHAHASLNREMDSPKLATLQACLLILHELPQMTGTTESPRIWGLACQATACAQILGLYRDPSAWKIPTWEKCLRKKLWWATYFTDKFTSICHGNPSHISSNSYDVRELTMEDLACDEEVHGSPGESVLDEEDMRYDKHNATQFLEIVRLSQILSSLLGHSYVVNTSSGFSPGFTSNEHSRLAQLVQLENWYSLQLNEYSNQDTSIAILRNQNGPLQLAYYAVKTLAFRALLSPASSAARKDPSSALRRHFAAALNDFRGFVTCVARIGKEDLEGFWGRHARNNLLITGNFLIYLFLLATTESEVSAAYSLLQQYHTSLTFLRRIASQTSIGLIRPALLRTDSFFQEAVEILKNGVQ